ncbi:hypothetical protein SCLCIDRAFT_102219, partial [Scleroderma citrinum Foug A]
DPIVELNNYLQGIGAREALSWKESKTGPPHEPIWSFICKVSGQEYGIGTGTRKHVAQGAAASEALTRLRAEHEGQ